VGIVTASLPLSEDGRAERVNLMELQAQLDTAGEKSAC
jgi:hypothetical protein